MENEGDEGGGDEGGREKREGGGNIEKKGS